MRISLITVSYNSQDSIKETLDSVVRQITDGFELEYIIIDGNSTDSTLEIISSYKDYISLLISEKDKGIYDAMNKGLYNATGDVIGYLNSDDYFTDDNVLSDIYQAFKNDNYSIVYGDINYVKEHEIKRKWVSGPPKSLADGWHPPHPGFYARKELFVKYGGFDDTMLIAADFELMLRFVNANRDNMHYLSRPIVNMNLGGISNSSLRNILRGNKEILQAFKKNGLHPSKLYTLKRWLKKLKQY
jgi:glycosyltransferase involved in cell wall biosynthesis